MRIGRKSSPAEVAGRVADALSRAGIRAVLTGGACASIYTAGHYQSVDLDFVLQTPVTRVRLDAVMGSVGFQRRGNQYFHALARFYVEFPPGPLAIGNDYRIGPVVRKVGAFRVVMLSQTDSCRDRLAAFLHWSDQQNLRTAVMIAARNEVDLESIRGWATREGARERFEEFLRALERARTRRGQRRGPRKPKRER